MCPARAHEYSDERLNSKVGVYPLTREKLTLYTRELYPELGVQVLMVRKD